MTKSLGALFRESFVLGWLDGIGGEIQYGVLVFTEEDDPLSFVSDRCSLKLDVPPEPSVQERGMF